MLVASVGANDFSLPPVGDQLRDQVFALGQQRADLSEQALQRGGAGLSQAPVHRLVTDAKAWIVPQSRHAHAPPDRSLFSRTRCLCHTVLLDPPIRVRVTYCRSLLINGITSSL